MHPSSQPQLTQAEAKEQMPPPAVANKTVKAKPAPTSMFGSMKGGFFNTPASRLSPPPKTNPSHPSAPLQPSRVPTKAFIGRQSPLHQREMEQTRETMLTTRCGVCVCVSAEEVKDGEEAEEDIPFIRPSAQPRTSRSLPPTTLPHPPAASASRPVSPFHLSPLCVCLRFDEVQQAVNQVAGVSQFSSPPHPAPSTALAASDPPPAACADVTSADFMAKFQSPVRARPRTQATPASPRPWPTSSATRRPPCGNTPTTRTSSSSSCQHCSPPLPVANAASG